jgi:hypothetical protein
LLSSKLGEKVTTLVLDTVHWFPDTVEAHGGELKLISSHPLESTKLSGLFPNITSFRVNSVSSYPFTWLMATVSSWPELIHLEIINSTPLRHDEEYTVFAYTQLASLTLGEGDRSDLIMRWLYNTGTVISLQRLVLWVDPGEEFSPIIKFLAHPNSTVKHLQLTLNLTFRYDDEYQCSLWPKGTYTLV